MALFKKDKKLLNLGKQQRKKDTAGYQAVDWTFFNLHFVHVSNKFITEEISIWRKIGGWYQFCCRLCFVICRNDTLGLVPPSHSFRSFSQKKSAVVHIYVGNIVLKKYMEKIFNRVCSILCMLYIYYCNYKSTTNVLSMHVGHKTIL